MKETILLILAAFGVGLLLWGAAGLLHRPLFGVHTVQLCYVQGDGGRLEHQVRAFGWLRGSGLTGGTLLLVDCGLTARGLGTAQLLQRQHSWVRYCPRETLGDYLELAEDIV